MHLKILPLRSVCKNKCHQAPHVLMDEDLTPELVFQAHLGDIAGSAPNKVQPRLMFFY